jgi:PIN domain nuclease of toxin-antitoxin system
VGSREVIVLDTHAFLWWVSQDSQLSRSAARRIADANRVGVSAISHWEVAMLVQKRRLELDRDVLDWLNQAMEMPKLQTLELTPEIAVRSTRLSSQFHQDPADRLIVATAIEHNASVVTCDQRIAQYGGVDVVW